MTAGSDNSAVESLTSVLYTDNNGHCSPINVTTGTTNNGARSMMAGSWLKGGVSVVVPLPSVVRGGGSRGDGCDNGGCGRSLGECGGGLGLCGGGADNNNNSNDNKS